jgi:hypothetical protein
VRQRFWLATMAAWLASAACGWAQFHDDPLEGDKPGEVAVQRWRIGMIITAEGSGFRSIVGTVTVPADWPEQRVRAVEEDLSSGVSISYQTVEDTARQMVIKVPTLAAGQQAKAVVTFEIRRVLSPAPEGTDRLTPPNPRRPDRKLATHLGPSPYIESTHPEIRKLAKEIGTEKKAAWEHVEAIYDWVREKVQYKEDKDQPPKSALAAFHDGTGACDEMSSLFIAICRAAGIPARTVRVPGHCYPEFYLLGAEGKGHWYPCQASGTRAFGRMPDPRPILQKGDNVPGVDPRTKKRVRHRFLPETLVGLPVGPGGSLRPQLVCEQVREKDQGPRTKDQGPRHKCKSPGSKRQ